MGRTRNIACLILAILTISSLFLVAYHFNGDSADFSRSDIRLVRTDSMAGEAREQYAIASIPANSLVMIHSLESEELSTLEVGDVIAFNYVVSPGNTILDCHRIIEIYTDGDDVTGFKTQGDYYSDTSIYEYPTADETVGKVVSVSHAAGTFVQVVQGNLAIWIMMAVVLSVIIMAFVDLIRIKMASDKLYHPESGSR